MNPSDTLPANEKSDSALHSSLSEAACVNFPCGIKVFGNLGSDLHPTVVKGFEFSYQLSL